MMDCSVILALLFGGSLLSWHYHVTTAEFVYIQLNENGSLADDSPVPECTTGSRINILSYNYYNRKCQTNCINLSSPEAEIQLHEACSFKEKCTNMTFPVADIKSQGFNTLHVNYQCEDLQEDFYDMCRNDKSILKSKTHIILNQTQQDVEQCKCYISDGTFSISVSDVRLQSKSGHNCSTHKLIIDTRVMSCNGHDGEKMFNRHIEEFEDAMVALTGISVNSPQMVWLTLTPREGETTIIKCGTRSKTSSSITTTSTSLQSASFTDGIRMPKHDVTSAFPVLAAFVQNIQLDHNGNIKNESPLPACTVGKIKLLSYKFCQDANHCEGTNMGKASPAEEELIHRMCSLKKNCTDPGKPLKKGFGMLTVSYDCLGLYEQTVDMCENNTFSNSILIRLRYDGSETSYEKCQCNITGDFHLTLEDVRLRRMNSDLCSPAKLQVNSRVYGCADGMEAKGAVFHEQINNLKQAHVVFTSNSQMVKPEMIYWTIRPEVNIVYVTCQNIPIKIVSTTTELVETKDVTESDEPYTGAGTTTSSVGMVANGSGATLLIVLVCVAVWLIRRNREKKRRIEHLENLIANRNKQQCVHPEEFQNSMVNSLARDDRINKDDGDYVGWLRCANLRQEQTDDCGDHQTREDETDTAFAEEQCGTDYEGSKSNRKWWRKKSPKQNTAVYSYATQESLLRGTSGAEGGCEREAASVTDSCTAKQSLTASDTKPDNYYLTLLPIEESTKCSLDVGATKPQQEITKETKTKQKKN